MRRIIILLLLSTIYGQVDSDFISPGDFVDRKPTLPEVVLPNFVEDKDVDYSDMLNTGNLSKDIEFKLCFQKSRSFGFLAKQKLERLLKKKFYTQFELPNYKLRMGNFPVEKKLSYIV
ncbi:MAG: hypothetical protein CM1200mP31_1960 [Candidatus Neomarinimicrobiota bacterium]|nr:MAG: hypothetical protein CM1200mP31_1960 [Candidatus Neomarinimicrobiota bacterium]